MITSRTCDKDDPNKSWIIHFALSPYNVVKCVTYFALIFKLVETPGGGGGGGGGSDIFIHTYGLDHFQGFRKMNIFGGIKILWIFWVVIT